MRLVLFRHGDAEPEQGLGDHARKLSRKGISQAQKSGLALSKELSGRTLFLVSDGVRARETFSQIQTWFSDCSVIEDGSLYLAGLEQFRNLINQTNPDDSIENIVVVGHNPGLSLALVAMAGDLKGLGTADAAVLSLVEANWKKALASTKKWKIDVIFRG